MKQIPLTQGKFALVDDADFDWLNQWKWFFNQGYAFRTDRTGIKQRSIRMHAFITNTPVGLDTDHIDGNGLNNQRDNLRICEHIENCRNVKKHKDGSAKYKGITKRRNYWRALINVNSKFINLGNFNNEEEAARAYDEAAKKYFGSFSKLNFPE
jgi:hypothetical protein